MKKIVPGKVIAGKKIAATGEGQNLEFLGRKSRTTDFSEF